MGIEKLRDVRDKPQEIVLADGKTYKLLYNFNAMCDLAEIEEELGMDKRDETGENPVFDWRHMRAKLWVGLRKYHPEVKTLEDAGELIPLNDFVRVCQEINRIFLESLPIAKKAVGEPAGKPTGSLFITSSAGTSEKTSSGSQPPERSPE